MALLWGPSVSRNGTMAKHPWSNIHLLNSLKQQSISYVQRNQTVLCVKSLMSNIHYYINLFSHYTITKTNFFILYPRYFTKFHFIWEWCRFYQENHFTGKMMSEYWICQQIASPIQTQNLNPLTNVLPMDIASNIYHLLSVGCSDRLYRLERIQTWLLVVYNYIPLIQRQSL